MGGSDMPELAGRAAPTGLARWTARPAGRAGLLGLTGALWLIAQFAFFPGHTLNATRFIYYDQGSFLYVLDCLERGEVLYRDIAWQYGPLAIAWFAAFAKVLGNSPVTLVLASGAAVILTWVVIVELASRVLGFARAWLGGVCVLLPVMTHLLLRGFNNGPHSAVEALALAMVALLLARPARDWRGALGVGVVLGLLQMVRFGPHLVAGFVVGVLWVWSMEGRKWRERVSQLVAIGVAYALVWTGYAAWLATRLPAEAWGDQLWPSFMTEHYRQAFQNRFPAVVGSWDAIVRWLPMAVALGLAVMAFVRPVRRGGRDGASAVPAALLVFPGYFLVAAAVLFRSGYHVSGHLWLLWAALPLAWLGAGRTGPVLAVMAALAGAAGNVEAWRGYLRDERAPDVALRVMPNGQRLWFRGPEERMFGALEQSLAELPRPRRESRRPRAAVMFAGGGVYYFFGLQRPEGRHWWFLAAFVRPWEEARTAESLKRCDVFLPFWSTNARISKQSPPAEGLALWFPISATHVGDLPDRLRFERWILGVGAVFSVQEPR